MGATAKWRDYSLTRPESGNSVADEEWYISPVPRKRLKQLMQRSDAPALLDYGLWLTLVAVSGGVAYLSWGTWWAVPAFLVYGVLYASCADSRHHEGTHGTVFRTRWLGEAFFNLASFMALKNAYLWRWSHTRHHTHTIVVGRDPEIAYPRPPDLFGIVRNFLHLKAGLIEMERLVRHVFGRLNAAERDYVPNSERGKVVWTARAYLAMLAGVIAWSVATRSWMPVMFVGLPTFYGSWLHHLLSAMQHAGLAEDTPDHRLNSRTVMVNPILGFIYSNMNYHVEHHMFPTVPYHALPALHEEIKDDCPPVYHGMWEAYREMIPAMRKQQTDPEHYVPRALPSTARPSPVASSAAPPAMSASAAAAAAE